MTESFNDWTDFMTDQVTSAALSQVGPPLTGLSSSMSYPSVVNLQAVIAQIFGTQLDLKNRPALFALLNRVLPAIDGATTGSITQLPESFSSAQTGRPGVIGPFAPVFLAAQTLLGNVGLVTAIKPLEECSKRMECCDYQTLVPLIQDVISQLVRELSTPDVPFKARIDVLLSALCGYDPVNGTPLEINDVRGYLGSLRERCGLDPSNVCSLSDEQVMTAFSSLVAFTGVIVRLWDAVREKDGGDFLTVGIYALRRNLGALGSSLACLSDLVPRSAWLTSELPTTPRIGAWQLYEWIQRYARTEALQTLRDGGRDGICTIARTMREFATLLAAGFLDQGDSGTGRPPAPAKGDYALVEDYCSGIPPAFDTDEVKAVVREMLCNIQRVLALAGEMACDPSTTKQSVTPPPRSGTYKRHAPSTTAR
jgi:hypothetical protein